ncbi:hypothetical protein E3P92_02163 [Wallemia ichthyophaga]|nr:hypothetical protein E3P92_02163 [Wallemia ichthyophaga]
MQDKTAIVFVHGFKGGVDTFGSLPQDMECWLGMQTELDKYTSTVYPAWKTSGKLEIAVDNLQAWMAEQQLQNQYTAFVLVAHSMGGLLACDVYLKSLREGNKLNIKAVLNLDCPMIGLHPHVFANTTNDYYNKFNKVKDVASGASVLIPFVGALWGANKSDKSAAEQRDEREKKVKDKEHNVQPNTNYLKPAGAAIAAISAVGAGAYFGRDKILEAYRAAAGLTTDHLLFLSNLWNTRSLKERLDSMSNAPVVFKNYYTHLPHLNDRTFCLIPAKHSSFIKTSNSLANDEISAHINMFNASSNSSYHQLLKHLVEDAL